VLQIDPEGCDDEKGVSPPGGRRDSASIDSKNCPLSFDKNECID
jgi:hypothetical protein